MLTHHNLIAAEAMVAAAFKRLEPDREVALAFLPFFHIYGQVVVMLHGLCQGQLLVLFANPDTEEMLAAMERYGATVFYGVPTLFEYLKDNKDTDKVNWRRLKLVLSGADGQVFRTAGRNYVLSQGRIIASGTGAELRADARLRAGYLGL